MKKVRVRLSDATKWERAIRTVTNNYLARMVARSILVVNEAKQEAPKISEIAEAMEFAEIDYPTQEQVLKRWNRVKNKIKVKNPSIWKPSLIPNFSEYMQRIVDREDERFFTELLIGLKQEAYTSAATKAAIALGRDMVTSPETLEAIRAKTIKIVTTEITPTMRNKLVAKLEETVNAGFTIEETAHDLGFLNTNWRTIAKTETFDVMNKGTYDQVKNEAAEYGAETFKYWQHSGNTNGRPSHVQAGQTYDEANAIPMDEPFIVDGESLQFPHDPNGSAANNVNCGCTAVYVIK